MATFSRQSCEVTNRNVKEAYRDPDPRKYVISHNLHRRYLSETQQEVVAPKLAKLKHGGERGNQHTGGKGSNDTLADAASQLNVSEPSVIRFARFFRKWTSRIMNCYRACIDLGIEPRTCELDANEDPVAFAISTNLHRRHLTEAQRGMVGARLRDVFDREARNRKLRPERQQEKSNFLGFR